MKRTNLPLICATAVCALATTAQAEDVLTVYTSRAEELIMPLLDEFTAETGIKTQMLNDNPQKLLARLDAEGEGTPADLFLPADVVSLEQAADRGMLETLTTQSILDDIPAKYRDQENQWVGLGKRYRVVAYNKETVNPETDLSTYEALADPKWDDQIMVRTSSHPYNLSLISALIEEDGAEATEAWVTGIVENLARAPQGGDRDQIKAIAAGEGKLAIVNSYYFARMLNSTVPEELEAAAKTGLYFPNQDAGEGELQGAHVNFSGAGVIAFSDMKPEAEALVAFLASADGQKLYAELNQEYPANPNAELSETLKTLGVPVEDDIILDNLADNYQTAIEITDRSGWK